MRLDPPTSPGPSLPVAPAGTGAHVRLTLAGEDVELERGARLGALRTRLAEVLGRAELLGAPLTIGTRTLDDDALVGFEPLVDGADVLVHAPRRNLPTPGDDPVRGARAALAAPARWEVVAGPRAGLVTTDVTAATDGRVVAPPPRRPPRGGTMPGARASRVRPARPRPGTPAATLPARSSRASRTQLAGPAPVRLRRDHGRGRPVRLGPLGRRVRDGDVLHVGPGAVRRVVVDATASGTARTTPEQGVTPRAPATGPGLPLTTILVPLVSAGMLALVTGRPAFALVGLVGPLALGVAALVRRVRREAPRAAPTPTTWHALAAAPVTLTTRIATGETGDAGPGPRALAATGPSARARARAAVLAFAVLHPGAPVTTVGSPTGTWEWARWLGARPGGDVEAPEPSPDAPRLVVVTVTDPEDARRASERWARAGSGTHVLLVVPGAARPAPPAVAAVPAWCEADVAGPGVGPGLADALARALAPHVARAGGAAHAATVPLADLLGLDTAAPVATLARGIRARWQQAPAHPLAPVGRLADGSGTPWVLDLVRDGPHGIVAGTTGAGKSELLQTLVLSLALTHPPERVAFVLVDHKGGAGFGPCLDLPHVAGVATDLEPGSARRALAALRAELRSREHLLARHGLADVDALLARSPEACPPRLVVVVDELRALADDDPDLLGSFLRIAAQGRSLGLHLVLATQRPAGAVSADVRANVGLRVALRVASDADSRDVVEVPDAAALPAAAPGLAVVVTSHASHRTVRCALASASSTPVTARVRRVPRTPGPARSAPPTWGGDVASRLVAAATAAVDAAGMTRAAPLWPPPLPLRCTTADAPLGAAAVADDRPATPAPLPVALLDEPDERRRSVAAWDPARGHLHVEGAPGSGRTTVLRALALEAAAHGMHVHVLGPHPLVTPPGTEAAEVPGGTRTTARTAPAPAPVAPPGWYGTHATASDPRRAHALLARLLAEPPAVPTLVLVDGVEEMLAALGRVGRGAGTDTLVALARQPATHGVRLALAGSRALTGPLAAALGPRLVLTGSDRTGDLARGVPSALAGLGGAPGRGVWTGAGPARLAQAFVPRAGVPDPGHVPGVATVPAVDAPAVDAPAGNLPVRILPLPAAAGPAAVAQLRDAAHAARAPGLAPLGHGGDEAGPRLVDVTRDVLVVGPPGSGRTSTLARLARHAARVGPVLVVGTWPEHGEDRLGSVLTVPTTSEGLARAADVAATGAWTLVVDDVDVLARLLPAEHDRLASLPGVVRCLVAATTASATLVTRGLLGRARAARHGVVLDPGRPGSADALATDVADVVEPGPCPPGRGALVVDGRAELVQVLRPGLDADVGPVPVLAPDGDGRG